MENFIFQNSTKIIFGKDKEKLVGKEIVTYGNKILLHYGGGSIKKTGLYDKIVNSINEADLSFIELSGVKPNPRLDLIKKGIDTCRKEKVDAILAVGGGSVIDSAKAIGIGAMYNGDVWDLFENKAPIESTLPVGVVLTIPAAGSETSGTSVITNEKSRYKRGISHNIMRPKFAILNPELTYTLPPFQTAAGGVDIISHVLERYFTNVSNVDLTDKLCEGTLKSIIKNLPFVLNEPKNYNARAEIMWAGTIAHGDLLDTGRIGDWGSHMIAHEISAMYDITHGATLSIIFPAWMKYVYKNNVKRFAQYAERVWNVELDLDNLDSTALYGIQKTELFFKSIGMPVSFKDASIPSDRVDEMAFKCTQRGPVGNFVKLEKKDVLEILKIASQLV
ncbi:MAG: iron-containing alcohol dehydrogenase [Tepidanaerobacteraceae bacterium]|jgi:alcohol dehydrogenase YqhD (iron-dependent ADH family)